MADAEKLLSRSTEFGEVMSEFLTLPPYDTSPRTKLCYTLLVVSFEHAESVRILIVNGNFTSSFGVLRMQYEALVKAMWILYAASEKSVSNFTLTFEQASVKKADDLPILSKMLEELQENSPDYVRMTIPSLLEFKKYSWGPLSSYIHGGIHAIERHSKGYPQPLLSQAVRFSNALLITTGAMLVTLSGDLQQFGKIPQLQKSFADCLPAFAK